MYPLFFETLANIQYRINKGEGDTYYWIDSKIKNALEEALEATSTKGLATKFIKALKNIFGEFKKEILVDQFGTDFVNNEMTLEAEIKHESHILHVIRVFLIGYNIITSWPYLTNKFKRSSKNSYYNFPRFFLSWLMASLFHDFGYIIEKTHERFRAINNQYKDILQRFKGIKILSEEPLDIGNNITTVKFLYKIYKNKLHKKITLDKFIDLFKVKSSKLRELDHGFVSAICFVEMIDLAQKKYKLNDIRNNRFMDNEMNLYASLAMFLHNFHMISFDEEDERKNLNLSCTRKAEIIPYLLILCDLVQVWGRKRKIFDDINNKLKKIEAYKKLDFCKFGEDLAILQINHVLQNKLKIRDYADELGKEFLSKQEKITMEIEYLYPKGEITIQPDLEEEIRAQKTIEEQSHFILNPMNNNKYKIVLNHLIEGIHYYTINYYL